MLLTAKSFLVHISSPFFHATRCFTGLAADYVHRSPRELYPTVDSRLILNASCLILESPPPLSFELNFNREYTDEEDDLLTAEVSFAKENVLSPINPNLRRFNVFLGGRMAIRRAARLLRFESVLPPILKNSYGAPTVPDYISCSISHKDNLIVGVALSKNSEERSSIGVDIERCTNKAGLALGRKVLTDNERNRLGSLVGNGIALEEVNKIQYYLGLSNCEKLLKEVLLRFSFKEALFKAIHPNLLR
jgi:4'-phosphopantetheinyl transferase EntD